MPDHITLPGIRPGQVWRAKQPQQKLPYLHIRSMTHQYVEGRLSTDPELTIQGRNTRILRDAVPGRYVLVIEGGAPDA